MSCEKCRFAQWQLTPTGRIRPKVAGKCTFVIPVPVLPGCAERDYRKPMQSGIWPGMYPDCKTFQPKESK